MTEVTPQVTIDALGLPPSTDAATAMYIGTLALGIGLAKAQLRMLANADAMPPLET
jgi:hypothetical protein